ncbi:Gelsolin-like protein 1 [Exaiptasia diaphana]|nr:Gelsolin-like protein 1 [Exaiptasia diaphana]
MSKFSMQQRREEKPKEEQEEEDDSWKDTNVGMIGSDLDRSVRKDAANTEKAWQNAGQKPGVEVWRINKFKISCKVEFLPKRKFSYESVYRLL